MSTAMDPDAGTIARRFYDAMETGDIDTARRLLAPDAVLTVPGRNPLSGSYVGPDGLVAFVSKVASISTGAARTQTVDVLAGGARVVVYGITRATRPGHAPLTNHTLHLMTVAADVITAIMVFNADQHSVDRFWS